MSRLALTAVLLLAACVSFERRSLIPEGGNEIFLSYFENDTFYRGLEFSLTQRVADEILSRPGLKLTSREQAEVLLSGRILQVRQRVLSEDPTRAVTSLNTNVTVMVELTDARSGKLLKRQRVSQSGEFVPALGETLEAARREAFALLARDVVRLLEEDF